MTSQASLQIKATVGGNIAAAREERGWTQRVLAFKLGLDTQSVSRWERGYVLPSPANLVALALRLDRDPAWFYTDHSAERSAA